MILDIGGMQIYGNDKKGDGFSIKSDKKYCYFLNDGRNALKQVLAEEKVKKAYVCIYNCDTVFEPFFLNNIETVFYKVDKHFNVVDLLDKLDAETNKCLVYIQEYFVNYCLDDIKKQLAKKSNIVLVEDITHSLLDNRVFNNADYFVGSIRKWAGSGEGGILLTNKEIKIPYNDGLIMDLYEEMAPLQKQYNLTKDTEKKLQYRIIQDKINKIFDNAVVQQIDSRALREIETIDYDYIKQKRRENYIYLLNKLKALDFIELPIDYINDETVPLYLPIYVENKFALQHFLFRYNIYFTILWPKYDRITSQCNDEINYMYDRMLNIHIDQRYDLKDMDRIYNALVDYKQQILNK